MDGKTEATNCLAVPGYTSGIPSYPGPEEPPLSYGCGSESCCCRTAIPPSLRIQFSKQPGWEGSLPQTRPSFQSGAKARVAG